MQRLMKKVLTVLLILAVAGAILPTGALAARTETTTEFVTAGYTLSENLHNIVRDRIITIQVALWRPSGDTGAISIVRGSDSFKEGTVTTTGPDTEGVYTATFTNVRYTGTGKTLSFTVYTPTNYQQVSVTINECKEYEEPAPSVGDYTPSPLPEPRAVFACRELDKPIEAGEVVDFWVSVRNIGNSIMVSPVLTLTPSSELMILDGKSAYVLPNIRPDTTESVPIKLQAVDKITTQRQSIEAALSFTYANNISSVAGQATGTLSLLSKVTPEPEKEEEPEKKPEETPTASPVPTVILTDFFYGDEAVSAGEEATLVFTFQNTSRRLAIDNVTVTVNTGSDLLLNGATNTFYFERIGTKESKTVSVPVKAVPMLSGSIQDVTASFHYEYVDNKVRSSASADLHMSVPLYQPDRFEVSPPKAEYVGMVGEEISLTVDYVNKGKTAVANVEATVSGDVDSYTPYQRVGNVESGKSGTIAFPVTPMLEGDNEVTVKIVYEDANGDAKEVELTTTLTTMPYVEPDWGGEDPGMIEPEPQGGGFPWWILIAVAVAAVIVAAVVLSKRKKKKKLAAEKAMMEAWDDEFDKEVETK